MMIYDYTDGINSYYEHDMSCVPTNSGIKQGEHTRYIYSISCIVRVSMALNA